MRLHTGSSAYYSITVLSSTNTVDGWEASFDGGLTWKDGEADPNNAGYTRWLVYGPTFLSTVAGSGVTPVEGTPVIPTEGITPFIRLKDDPLIVITDAPFIEVYATSETYTGVVTIEEFRRFMNNANWNGKQKLSAQSRLRAAQGDLERYCNRPVQLVQVREYAQVDSTGYLNVSVSPVWKIVTYQRTSDVATVDVLPPQIDPYTPPALERDEMIGANGRVIDLAPNSWTSPMIVPGGIYVGSMVNSWYFIDYVAGYDGSNDEGLKNAIMQVASRGMENHHDDTISLRDDGAAQAAASDERPPEWQPEELMKFDRIRRRVVV